MGRHGVFRYRFAPEEVEKMGVGHPTKRVHGMTEDTDVYVQRFMNSSQREFFAHFLEAYTCPIKDSMLLPCGGVYLQPTPSLRRLLHPSWWYTPGNRS